MRHAWLTLVALFLGAVPLAIPNVDQGQVQIAFYPYFHDPAAAWRLSILTDGTVRYEESATLVKVSVITDDDATQWEAHRCDVPKRLSPRKVQEILERLRALQLGTLRFRYSADHTYTDRMSETLVVAESGASSTTPAEVSRIVTHGATYRLRVSVGGVLSDSVVYAPVSALEWKAPEHPDREAIVKILSGWYEVLRAVGPVNGNDAKMFRQAMK